MQPYSLPVDVMDDELMATLEHIHRHTGSHRSQANKSDFHVFSLSDKRCPDQ